MNLEKIKDRSLIAGSSLQGYINIPYAELVAIFGEPTSDGDGYKVDAEWELMIDHTLVTIYNYKDGKNYNGDDGDAVEDITQWHIGGHDEMATKAVYAYVEEYRAKTEPPVEEVVSKEDDDLSKEEYEAIGRAVVDVVLQIDNFIKWLKS